MSSQNDGTPTSARWGEIAIELRALGRVDVLRSTEKALHARPAPHLLARPDAAALFVQHYDRLRDDRALRRVALARKLLPQMKDGYSQLCDDARDSKGGAGPDAMLPEVCTALAGEVARMASEVAAMAGEPCDARAWASVAENTAALVAETPRAGLVAPSRSFSEPTRAVTWKYALTELRRAGVDVFPTAHALRMASQRAAAASTEDVLGFLSRYRIGAGERTRCRLDVVEYVCAAMKGAADRTKAEVASRVAAAATERRRAEDCARAGVARTSRRLSG